LSTHGGSEGVEGYSQGKKTKTLGYFFNKSTKPSIDGDRSIKRL